MFIFKLRVFIFIFSFLSYSALTYAQGNQSQDLNSASNARMYAKLELASNYIEDGLTQTQSTWGFVSDIGYRMPQFEIGVRASNASYPNEQVHICLKPHVSIIANFSQTSRFFIDYEMRQYYTIGDRNGGAATLGLDIGQFRIRHKDTTNWENTDYYKSKWSFGYDFLVGDNFIVPLDAGYNILDVSTHPNYVDATTGIIYRQVNVDYFAKVTYTNGTTPFAGAQEAQVYVGLSASY